MHLPGGGVLVFGNVNVASRRRSFASFPSLFLRNHLARFTGALLVAVLVLTPVAGAAEDDALAAAAREFVAKVIAAVRPAKSVSLRDEYLSALPPSGPIRVRELLEQELQKNGIAVTREAENNIRLTFAESTSSYLWIAQVAAKEDVREVFLEVPRGALPSVETRVQVSLRVQRIWQQESPLLFAGEVKKADSPEARMVLLAPGELIQLSSAAAGATAARRVALARRARAERAETGSVSVTDAGMHVHFANETCVVTWDGDDAATCNPMPADKQKRNAGAARVAPILWNGRNWQLEMEEAGSVTIIPPGEASAFRFANVGAEASASLLPCAPGILLLTTGSGDWTVPDAIEAHLLQPEAAFRESQKLELPGPVLRLTRAAEDGHFFAVVRNLKTSRYEVYAITAECAR